MTNDQYEKDSVMRGLQGHDQVIHSLEEALRVANESRREYVNRYNLNKCEHDWEDMVGGNDNEHDWRCKSCGKIVKHNFVKRRLTPDGVKFEQNGEDDQHAHMVD